MIHECKNGNIAKLEHDTKIVRFINEEFSLVVNIPFEDLQHIAKLLNYKESLIKGGVN